MKFENQIRIVNFKLNLDSTNLDGVIFAKNFLKRYKHPDTKLLVKIETNDIDYHKLYNATSILSTIDNISLNIESTFKNFGSRELKLINEIYDSILINKDSNYREEDESLIYLAANGKNVVAKYIIDENNTDLYKFKNFYDVLAIRNTYNIDFFSEIRNKKEFLDILLKEFDYIMKDNINYIYNINHSDPLKDLMFKENKIIDKEHSDTNLVDKNLNIINIDTILNKNNLDKCTGCPVIESCRGGDYDIIENSNNSDIFCAINMGIFYLRDKYLKGVK